MVTLIDYEIVVFFGIKSSWMVSPAQRLDGREQDLFSWSMESKAANASR